MSSNEGFYVPLHVRHGSHIVQEAWKRGYDWETTRNIQRLQESGALRALPVGWWLRGAGWCPTDGVLFHMLKRRGYAKVYVPAAGRPNPARERLRDLPGPAACALLCVAFLELLRVVV